MKDNMMQRIVGFILKYIWLFCIILIILECTSTLYSAKILMQQTTDGVIQSVSGELSGRVDGVLRLLKGLTVDERFTDPAQPLYKRALLAAPYKKSYNLYMIAVTDKDVNVASTTPRKDPEKYFNLAYRDYMKRLYATGTFQITDAFPAGRDGVTMNYTIAVPILENGVAVGSIFGAIYFEDIENIIKRNTIPQRRHFYLLGSHNTFLTGSDAKVFGEGFLERTEDTHYFGTTAKELDGSMRAGIPTNYWEWGPNGLTYASTMRVAPTHWTLLYQVSFASVLLTLLPVLLIKICFYIFLCTGVAVFGRRYLQRQLGAVSHLLDKVATMQKELFQSESTDYSSLLEITEKGLTDQLTGLATRTVLFNRMQPFLANSNTHCAILFLDLDDLKRLNDTFGHEAGDCALIHFAKTLKQFEQQYHGIAARYGGDEFILLLADVNPQTIHTTAEELCNALRTTIKIKGTDIPIHSSVGIALFPDHGDKAEDLISKADFALYAAKQNGKNRYSLYHNNTKEGLLL